MYTRISKLDFTILKWMIKAINTWSRCPRLAYIASNNFIDKCQAIRTCRNKMPMGI